MSSRSSGRKGLYAFDMNGRPVWKKDLGVLNTGAYDLPEYEWGTASSPIIYKNLVIVQCDTQSESFVMASDVKTGKTVWKTVAQGAAVVGHADGVSAERGGAAELVTNASNFIRGYDPDTGAERWRLGGSSKITAPTPIFSKDLVIVASGRAPERPIFAIKPGGSGDITPAADAALERARRVAQDRERLVHADAPHLRRHPLRARQRRVSSTPTIWRPALRSTASASSTAAAASARRRSLLTDGSTCRARTATSSSCGAGGRSSCWRRTRWENR